MTLEEMLTFFRRGFELLTPSRIQTLEQVGHDARRVNEALAVKVGYSPCSVSSPTTIEFVARTPKENSVTCGFMAIVVTIWKGDDRVSLLIVEDGSMLEARGSFLAPRKSSAEGARA